jgi:hypothetical protein
MASAAVREVIALGSALSEEDRLLVVDALAPRRAIDAMAEEWKAEIARRAERVRAGQSVGRPLDEVFDRLEAKLDGR